jgi:hypothetical protein
MTPSDFFRRSFCDAKGNPDGKLLTLAGLSGMLLASFPIGWVWGRWLPEAVLSSTYLFLAAGFGIDAFVTGKKIQADASVATATITGQQPGTTAAPAVGNADNVTINAPAGTDS